MIKTFPNSLRLAWFILLISNFLNAQTNTPSSLKLNDQAQTIEYANHPEKGLHKPIRNHFQNAEELVEQRTWKSKTFQNADGSITLAYSEEDMHYKDAQGWLRTISKRLETHQLNEGEYFQMHQKYPKVYNSANNAFSVALSSADEKMKWGQELVVRQTRSDKSIINTMNLNNNRHIEASPESGQLKVIDLFNGVDYQIQLDNFFFKSNFVLKNKDFIDATAETVYFSDVFELPEGYSIAGNDKSSLNGSFNQLSILDNNRNTVLQFMIPLISEAKDNRQGAIVYSAYYVKQISAHKYEVSIPVSASWLLSESRTYPITIDPLAIFENNAQMNSCFFPEYRQESSTIAVPEGNLIFNTFLSWDFVAVAGTQAWTEDQRSYVSGPNGETNVQTGTGSSEGTLTYNLNTSVANVISTGEIQLTWHAARIWGGSGCNASFNFISRRYAEITYGVFEVGVGTVMLNEYSCSNRQIADDFGNFEDWVEIYNPNPFAVDLTGYYLSDNPNNPLKWRFSGGVVMPEGHLIVICSGRDQMSGNTPHTNFRLAQLRPEYILFSNPEGTILESYILITTQNAHSRGRLTDGSSQWAYFPQSTPGAANQNGFINYTPKPVLDQQAGFYNSPINLQMSVPNEGFQIRYTTNGAEPIANSTLYTGPVELNQTTVIRARCFTSDPDYIPGFIETNTYFINETSTLPVFSFSGNQLNTLFGGTQIRPIGAFEYFDANGEFVDESVGEFNKHGNDSWSYPQRGVDFICRDEYGYNEALKHPFFATSNKAEFQRLMVKAAANDNYPFESGGAHLRDAYIQTLSQVSKLDLDERSSTFVLLFVNGQYWGVYDVRERVDDNDFTEFYYGQERKFRGSDEYIQFLKTWGSTEAEYGNQPALNDWAALVNFINQNNMSDEANYAFVKNQLNIASLIDYIVINSFVVSRDWLNYNTGWWRGLNTTASAQQWRYILWDMDAALGHFINYTGMPDVSATAPPCQVDNLNVGNGHIQSLRKLIEENEEAKTMYINRYADLINTHFSCENLLHLLDSMTAVIAPEMPRQIQRWGGNITTWQNNVQTLRNFINQRCNAMPGLLANCYQLSGPENITFMVEPEGAGEIKMNSEWLTSYPFTAPMFGNINSTFEARGNDFFTFSHWEISIPGSEPEQTQNPLIKNIEQSGIIKAVFVNPFEIPDDLDLIYYWHFNNFNSSVDVKEIPADYKLIPGTDPLMVYTGSGPRDIDPVNEGSGLNLRLNETEGRAARVRNPSNGRSLVFNLPTQGCTDLILRYAVQRTNQGMLRNIISYSIDGINFTQAGLSQTNFDMSTDFQLVSINFANATGVENNPNFHVRIEFEGNTNQDNGNNRFDNITLLGYYTDIGLSTLQPSGQLSIYPNPSKGNFIVEAHSDISQMLITDVAGRIIRRVQGIQQPIVNVDLSDSPSGIYFLELMIGDKSYKRKIVKH